VLFTLTVSEVAGFCSAFLTFLTVSPKCVDANAHSHATKSVLARSARQVFAEADEVTALASPSSLRLAIVFGKKFELSLRIIVMPFILHSSNSLANFLFHFA
jgi:hypothetical protein